MSTKKPTKAAISARRPARRVSTANPASYSAIGFGVTADSAIGNLGLPVQKILHPHAARSFGINRSAKQNCAIRHRCLVGLSPFFVPLYPVFMHRLTLLLAALVFVGAPSSFAQKQTQVKNPAPQTQPPPQPKAPALIDPAGPLVSLTDSEALFDIAVALNTCGYDNGLTQSDPVRAHIRDQVKAAIAQSPKGPADRDALCTFIDQHHLAESGLDLAQYVSLALYITSPPDLEPSAEEADMPPDSVTVEGILPILRKFTQDIDLHVIWASNRAAYDALISHLHDPLTKMIMDTNIYLKMPASTYGSNRFL